MVKAIEFTTRVFSLPRNTFLAGLISLWLLTHLPYMHLPACGNHVWRQCNTLAVAKNYADESMNLLEPRVDKRFDKTGITGPQFPAYEYILAIVYKTFGFSEHWHRWLSFLLMAIGIAGMYRLAEEYGANRLQAGVAASFLAFVPELYYHGINAVPDIAALAAMLWGWVSGKRWLKENNHLQAIFCAFALALAGMIKMQFLVAGVALCIEFLQRKNFSAKRIITGVLMAAFAAVFTFGWYAYAAFLVKRYGLHEFVHQMRHARSFAEGLSIFAKTLFSDFPEIFSGYAFLPLVAAGVYAVSKFRRPVHPLFFYSLACAAFYFLVQYQFLHHGYYAIIFLPAFALLAAKGFQFLLHSRLKFLLLLVWFAPIWAWSRMALSNWTPQHRRIPIEFQNPEQVREMRILSANKRWIVGPDISGCVYFYYTGAKGFPWDDSTRREDEFATFIKQGANGVIANRPDLLQKSMPKGFEYKEISRVGAFRFYSVGKN
jgi:hypothetical protein